MTHRSLSRLHTAQSTDVCIIGGGIVGLSAAWHCGRRNLKTTLLEANTLTSGSTWHAAGLIGTMKKSPIRSEMNMYSRHLYSQWGDAVGWRQTGSLAIAASKGSKMNLLYQYLVAKNMDPDVHLVSGADIQRIHPFLHSNKDTIGAHAVLDGIVNPADAAMHIAKLAKEKGANISQNTQVVGFDLSADGHSITGVKTRSESSGTRTIECGAVILAAGVHNRNLAKMLGVDVALSQVPHQYAIFDKIEGVTNELPVVRDLDGKYYCKPEVGGLMIGIFEEYPFPHLPPEPSGSGPTEEFVVFEESMDKFGNWFNMATDRFPVLNEVGVKSFLHGPDCHSTDHSFVLGPVLDNAVIAGGFNSQGIQGGPGAGLAVTEWLLDGRVSSFKNSFASYDVRRTWPKLAANDVWVQARACEGYGESYSPSFPREEMQSARGFARKSPLYSMLEREGAVFGEGFGWERPLYFLKQNEKQDVGHSLWTSHGPQGGRSPVRYSYNMKDTEWFEAERRESLAARNGAAVFDLSPFGKVKVTGVQAEQLVEYTVTANVSAAKLSAGEIVYTPWCNSHGFLLGDLTVSATARNEYYCVLPAADPLRFLDQLRKNTKTLGLKEVAFSDMTEEIAVVAVMGPQSFAILQNAFPEHGWTDHTVFTRQEVRKGIDAHRISYCGELGWELHVKRDEAIDVFNAVRQSAERLKVAPFEVAGAFALLNSLRFEKGYVHNHHDIVETMRPMEAGLDWAVDLGKDFCGKIAIQAAKKQPLKHRLVSIILKEHASLWGGDAEQVLRDGEVVGTVTTAGYSHLLDTPIGLAHVSVSEGPGSLKSRLEGHCYSVRTPYNGEVREFPAQVSLKPFVDPTNERMKAPHERG